MHGGSDESIDPIDPSIETERTPSDDAVDGVRSDADDPSPSIDGPVDRIVMIDDDADDRSEASRTDDADVGSVMAGAAAATSSVSSRPASPLSLPEAPPKAPPEMALAPAPPARGAETWYRTDQDRYKSVHRLANPWYRRLARGLIGLSFLAAAGVGLFFGARAVQDYLDRDTLPGVGADTPVFRSTSFEIRSTAPAPILDGTLTLDTQTGAFEYIGRGSGAQSGIQVVSEDGTDIFIRRGSGAFAPPGAADQVANDARTAAAYLIDDTSADALLTDRLRRNFVDLDDRTEIGEGDDQVTRYEVRIDTASFDRDFPLQYREFRDRAIPGVQEVRALPVAFTVDAQNVLVGVEDSATNWSWQRLDYSDRPFEPDRNNLGSSNTIAITDGNLP